MIYCNKNMTEVKIKKGKKKILTEKKSGDGGIRTLVPG